LRRSAAGLGLALPVEIITDGGLHRFSSNGRRGDDAGWYVYYPGSMPCGAFGCWRQGISQKWCARGRNELSATERVELRLRIQAAKRQRDEANLLVQQECLQRANQILDRSRPADPEHAYLRRKRVGVHGIHQDNDLLVIQVRDKNGDLHGLQLIDPAGKKVFLVGTRKIGCFFLIGEPNDVLVVAEGYATGASIHEATSYTVAVAFDAINLKPVAETLRRQQADSRIIIAGDHDLHGNGQVKAKAAAEAVGGVPVIPSELGDWNDIAVKHGHEHVRAAFAEALQFASLEVEPNEEAILSALAALSPMDYDRQRASAAERLGVRVSTLDGHVKRLRGEADSVEGGTTVTLDDPEPWPEHVNGVELLDALARTASRHLCLPTGAAETLALFIMHGHAHDTADISPILGVTSPTPECGKTTLLTLLGALMPRPLPASNITAAALFRSVELWRPSLLVDEADTFLANSDDLRGVINSGHNRSTAWVIRTAGEDHEPRRFATWAPKAIAQIGPLAPTLESRAIKIELRRMAEGEEVEPLRGDRLGYLQPLCRKAWRWAQDNAEALRMADPEIPSSLRGRTADNWRHLLAIADQVGGHWPETARRASETMSAGSSERIAGVMVLEDLRALYDDREVDRLPSAEIVEALGKIEDGPWSEWKKGKPITQCQLATLLKPFKIFPTTIRFPGLPKPAKGYYLSDFDDAFHRYLPRASVTSLQPNVARPSADAPSVTA
jgi:putative DNA primase/helicase